MNYHSKRNCYAIIPQAWLFFLFVLYSTFGENVIKRRQAASKTHQAVSTGKKLK
jgi:hypothetical protein